MQMPPDVPAEMVRIVNVHNAVMPSSEIIVFSDEEVAKAIVDHHD